MSKLKTLGALLAACCLMMTAAAIATPPKTKPDSISFRVYDSYFESNQSGLKGNASYLTFNNQQAFNKVFGAAAVMGKNSFLPDDAFQSKLVVAVIKRGGSVWKYSVQRVSALNGTLSIRYNAKATSGGGATFASPLIVAVAKKSYRSVVFIENGKRVGTAKLELAATPARVKIYLVAVGDNGKMGRKIGCDDSLVPVTRAITSPQSPLKAALQTLLSMPAHDAANPRLENFWKGNNLRLQSVALHNGVATIMISGEIFVAGICDEPRIIEQIEATARQFPTVKRVKVFIGHQSLAEAIS